MRLGGIQIVVRANLGVRLAGKPRSNHAFGAIGKLVEASLQHDHPLFFLQPRIRRALLSVNHVIERVGRRRLVPLLGRPPTFPLIMGVGV